MRVLSNTGHMDDLLGLQRLPAGTVMEVDDETAKRWARHTIAEATSLPLGIVSDAEAALTPEAIDAEIARLADLKASRAAAARPIDQEASAGLPADDEHPLARYDLPEQTRANLWRAGFTRPDLIDAASDADLLEVHGVGEGVLRRLRGGH